MTATTRRRATYSARAATAAVMWATRAARYSLNSIERTSTSGSVSPGAASSGGTITDVSTSRHGSCYLLAQSPVSSCSVLLIYIHHTYALVHTRRVFQLKLRPQDETLVHNKLRLGPICEWVQTMLTLQHYTLSYFV